MIIPRKFSYVTDLDKIISTEEIFQETKKHESVLKGTSITNLIYFSRTYTITNRNIDTARGNGYFSQPEIVEKLQLHFAHLYFEVINEYFESGSMPGQWLSAGASRRFGLMSAEVSLLLAVKAHIQCDAPLALGRLGVAPELVVSDYFRIQKVLMSLLEKW